MKENRHNYVNMKLSVRGVGEGVLFCWIGPLCSKDPEEAIKRPIVPRLSVVISYTFTI